MHNNKLGNIKIAVHAYIYLLKHSNKEDVVLYAQELVKTRCVNGKAKEGGLRDDQCVGGGFWIHFNPGQSYRSREPLVSDCSHLPGCYLLRGVMERGLWHSAQNSNSTW